MARHLYSRFNFSWSIKSPLFSFPGHVGRQSGRFEPRVNLGPTVYAGCSNILLPRVPPVDNTNPPIFSWVGFLEPVFDVSFASLRFNLAPLGFYFILFQALKVRNHPREGGAADLIFFFFLSAQSWGSLS